LGAAIGRTREGEATNLSNRSIEPPRGAWHVMPGISGWLKRRRLSQAAKRRCSSGHRCCVDGRPACKSAGSDPRVRTSARRWNAPRSSSERTTLRGACGNRRPQRCLVPRSRGAKRPVRAERARGSASRSSARTTNGVRGTGSRRGFARRNDGANLHSNRSGPRGTCLFGGTRCEARQPVPSPRGGGRRQRRGEGRHFSLQHEERSSSRSVPVHRRIAEVGRTSSGSEKRATSSGRVESLADTRSA